MANKGRRPVSSVELKSGQPEECRILLIGKTGNGKSATGNTILGSKKFKESVGIISATERAQLGEDPKRKLKVVDTPDVFADMEERYINREVRDWRYLTSPYPSAILIVIRADVRFTQEEYDIYRKTKGLLGKLLGDNLIVVFTMADKLKSERAFDEELSKANVELQQVLRDAKRRYVLFDNTAKASPDELQVQTLMDLIRRLPRKRGPNKLRLLLLGMTGSGKSATGNSILGRRAFRSCIGMDTVTTKCCRESGFAADYPVEIVDTPGIKDPQSFSSDLRVWLTDVSQHDFDVILFVMKGHDRFKDDAEYRLFEALKSVVDDVRKHVIIVFTGDDEMWRFRTDIRTLLTKAPSWLRSMIEETENRYVIFDNVTDDAKVKVLQRDDLFDMISELADRNDYRRVRIPQGLPTPEWTIHHDKHVRPTDQPKSVTSKCTVL